jgi:pyruvate dehydrogenase E2 component (dihydrolipoyllysine-residue acetyltransferase)
MAVAVEVPKLGNTVEECLISKWLKEEGQTVAAGEPVVEIETDKTSFEVEAPVAGTVLGRFFGQGELVPVFTALFVIGNPGENIDEFRPGGSAAPSASDQPAAPETPAPKAEVLSATPAAAGNLAPGSQAPLSPRARRFAEEHNFHPAVVAGSGPAGRVLENDVRKLYQTTPILSDAANSKLKQGGVVPQEGFGIGGMILGSDMGASGTQAKVAVEARAKAVAAAPATGAAEGPTKISGVRDKIARRLRESLAGTAQYTLNASADARGLLALRAKVKKAAIPGQDININDMVTFCTVQALLDSPHLNVLFVDGAIRQSQAVHIGFACDTPRGLLVPVVRDAQFLSVAGLAARMKELTAKAVAGSITADDLSGGTFTVSNLGGLGIESFTPVLNPPQVGILGIATIQLKAVRKDGMMAFIDSIGLSLTLDHQIIDGAPGARFLQVLREKIENVEKICTI